MDKITEKLKEVISKQEHLLKLKAMQQPPKPTSREKISPSVKTPPGK